MLKGRKYWRCKGFYQSKLQVSFIVIYLKLALAWKLGAGVKIGAGVEIGAAAEIATIRKNLQESEGIYKNL